VLVWTLGLGSTSASETRREKQPKSGMVFGDANRQHRF